jgi:predicted DNA binding CopG/RHH family protein
MKKQKNAKMVSSETEDPLAGDLSHLIREVDWKKFSDYFQFVKKDKTITLRVSDDVLKKFKKLAKEKNTKYQKLVYEAMVLYLIREKAS